MNEQLLGDKEAKTQESIALANGVLGSGEKTSEIMNRGFERIRRVANEIIPNLKRYSRRGKLVPALALSVALLSGCPKQEEVAQPAPPESGKIADQDIVKAPPPTPGVVTEKDEKKVLEEQHPANTHSETEEIDHEKQAIFDRASKIAMTEVAKMNPEGEVNVKSVVYFEKLHLARVDIVGEKGSGLFCLIDLRTDKYLGEIDVFGKDDNKLFSELQHKTGINPSVLKQTLDAYPEDGKITIFK